MIKLHIYRDRYSYLAITALMICLASACTSDFYKIDCTCLELERCECRETNVTTNSGDDTTNSGDDTTNSGDDTTNSGDDTTNETCQNNETKCETDQSGNGKLFTCSNGVWDAGTPCADNNSCKDGTECGDCKNGLTRCKTDQNVNSIIYTCSNGVWGSGTSCNNDYSCKDNTTCGDCKNGTTRCPKTGKTLYKCIKGIFVNTKCPGSSKCNNWGTDCD